MVIDNSLGYLIGFNGKREGALDWIPKSEAFRIVFSVLFTKIIKCSINDVCVFSLFLDGGVSSWANVIKDVDYECAVGLFWRGTHNRLHAQRTKRLLQTQGKTTQVQISI